MVANTYSFAESKFINSLMVLRISRNEKAHTHARVEIRMNYFITHCCKIVFWYRNRAELILLEM
jgi:hypothetical protein